MNPALELVRPSDPPRTPSPLAAARVQRKLTVEEAARLAGLLPDEVEWLEGGRLYRFRSTDDAIVAALLYAFALGIDQREARKLAGLRVSPLAPSQRGRLFALGGLAGALLALVLAVWLLPARSPAGSAEARVAARVGAALPAPWKVSVDVLNGSGDINYTRRVASRVGALGYQVARVARADRFDYPQTAVYYQPGGQALAVRLARELRVATRPLPGGKNPRRLVVVVGPQRGPG